MTMCAFVVASVVLGACPCETTPGGFAGGSGTSEDPYLICSRAQLELVADDLNAHYKLIGDVDMTGGPFTPIADGTFTDDSLLFDGTFDGNGFTIADLTVGSSTEDVFGLFGRIGPNGIVRDLHLMNVNITADRCAGAVAAENRGIIERCSATGVVTGTTFIGGLVGDNRALMRDCYSLTTVNGASSVGGLVGVTFAVGGTPTAQRCYAAGAVSGSSNVGGLIGSNLGPAVAMDCYWDIGETGQATSAGGDGRTTQQMMMQATYEPQWDFEMVWKIDEGKDYPRLRTPDNPGCCVGDTNSDNTVNLFDLLYLIDAWGTDDPAADFDASGAVDLFDLLDLLDAWGNC